MDIKSGKLTVCILITCNRLVYVVGLIADVTIHQLSDKSIHQLRDYNCSQSNLDSVPKRTCIGKRLLACVKKLID